MTWLFWSQHNTTKWKFTNKTNKDVILKRKKFRDRDRSRNWEGDRDEYWNEDWNEDWEWDRDLDRDWEGNYGWRLE